MEKACSIEGSKTWNEGLFVALEIEGGKSALLQSSTNPSIHTSFLLFLRDLVTQKHTRTQVRMDALHALRSSTIVQQLLHAARSGCGYQHDACARGGEGSKLPSHSRWKSDLWWMVSLAEITVHMLVVVSMDCSVVLLERQAFGSGWQVEG